MKNRMRPSYRTALDWLVYNADNDWVFSEDPIISVEAALVADLFGRSNGEIAEDIKARMARAGEA